MTGHYLAEFSCSYRPVKHGRPGVSILVVFLYSYSHCSCEQIGATHCKQLFALFFLSVSLLRSSQQHPDCALHLDVINIS